MKTKMSHLFGRLSLVALLALVVVGCAAPAPASTTAPTVAPVATKAPVSTAAPATSAPAATSAATTAPTSSAAAATKVPAPAGTTAPAASAAKAPPKGQPGIVLDAKLPDKYNEAPMLADLVKAGKLPTVDKRLPTAPVVIQPTSEIGVYGGTWRTVWRGLGDGANITQHLRHQRCVRFDGTQSKLEPDLCDTWQVSPDGKVYTFHIREGVKWSDGEPFTTDDIMFYYNDVLLNKDLTPTFPEQLTINKEPGIFEALDKYTFRITFKSPYGTFMDRMASDEPQGAAIKDHPKHYLQQFLPKYTAQDKLDAMVKAAGLQKWNQLFQQKVDWSINAELPQMTAWILKTPPDNTGRAIWERNPYFYKVDTAGNQLPYIDRVDYKATTSSDTADLMAIAGEIDFQLRYYRETDFAPLKEGEKQGGYRTVVFPSARGSDISIMLNQTTTDPVLRQIFQDVRFRRAVSLSINRDEINQVWYLGIGSSRQASFGSRTPMYLPEWEKAYAQYDPKAANALLDEMGLTKKDAEGTRLRPDGKPLEIVFEFRLLAGQRADPWELIGDYLKKVGIKVLLKPESQELYQTRQTLQDLQMGYWSHEFNQFSSYTELIPIKENQAAWGTEWRRWLQSDGKQGMEPPKDLLQIRDILNEASATTDGAKRNQLLQQAGTIFMNNLYVIGTVGEPPRAAVIKSGFMNVWEKAPYAIEAPSSSMYSEQFFIKR